MRAFFFGVNIMAQKDLIPVTQRSKEEAKKMSRNGGIASGKARRAKRTFKSVCEMCLKLKAPEDAVAKLKEKFPELKSEHIDVLQAIVLAQKGKAIDGDSKAFEIIRDTIGEKPVDRKEHTGEITVISESLTKAKERIRLLEEEVE